MYLGSSRTRTATARDVPRAQRWSSPSPLEPVFESPPATDESPPATDQSRPSTTVENSDVEVAANAQPPALDAAPSPPVDAASEDAWLTAEVGAKLALSPDGYGPAAGLHLGFTGRNERWVAAISGAMFTHHRLELTNSSTTLTRYPFELRGGYVLGPSAWELTLLLGVAVDSLVLSGEEDTTHLRLDLGPTAAVSVAYRALKVKPFLELDVRWFPRDYKLIFLPDGEVGRTPDVYLGATAGLHLEIL